MTGHENVHEFHRLREAIKQQAEVMRWQQAKVAADAVADGMSRRAFARAVGTDFGHIARLVKVWDRWGGDSRRPRFADAYITVGPSSGEPPAP